MDGDGFLSDVIICGILISSQESDQEQDTMNATCIEWVMLLWGRICEAFVLAIITTKRDATNGLEVKSFHLSQAFFTKKAS